MTTVHLIQESGKIWRSGFPGWQCLLCNVVIKTPVMLNHHLSQFHGVTKETGLFKDLDEEVKKFLEENLKKD